MQISSATLIRLLTFALGGLGSFFAAYAAMALTPSPQPYHAIVHVIFGIFGIFSAIKVTYARIFSQIYCIFLLLFASSMYLFHDTFHPFHNYPLTEVYAHIIYSIVMAFPAFILKMPPKSLN